MRSYYVLLPGGPKLCNRLYVLYVRTYVRSTDFTLVVPPLYQYQVRKGARARALSLSGRGMPVLNADVWGMIFSFLVEGRSPRCAEVDEAAFAAGIAAAGSGGRAR